jgi:chorismate dehydratase
MEALRIACVGYLNTAPLIEGLAKLEGVALAPAVPSRIAEMVVSGAADVGLVSLVDAAGSSALTLLPVGMIGCDGPTLTVRLYSSVPLEDIQAVHVDTDSHTSVVLCQLLLRRVYGVSPRVVGFDARERVVVGGSDTGAGGALDSGLDDAWPATVLLIGDKVVTDAPPQDRYPYQLDLGEAWKRLTGLPFVYAMWACRAEDAGTSRIGLAAALLDRQLRHNLTRLDWIVAQRGGEHRWPGDLARRYLSELLRFRVGQRERAGAMRFIAEAAGPGLLPAGELRWAEAPVAAVSA